MKEYRINEKQLESLKKLFEAFSLRHCEQILNELRGEGFIEYDYVGEFLDRLCNDLLEDSTEEIKSYTEAKRELKYLIEDIEGQEVEDTDHAR